MLILKFGGASLADVSNFENSIRWIVRQKQALVVVSAMQGVTNQLLECLNLAESREYSRFDEILDSIRFRHDQVIQKLVRDPEIVNQQIAELFQEARTLLEGVASLCEITPRAHDRLVSLGEKLSTRVLVAALNSCEFKADAVYGENVLVTDARFGNAFPGFESSKIACEKVLIPLVEKGVTPVVAGFTGATEDGLTTTLGRGGTDLTASMLARCLGANECWFMKEVDGIMSTDPRIVREAHTIEEMSYREVAELSFFGAKVLHPIAIQPLKISGIPARILNVYKPEFQGTLVKSVVNRTDDAVRALSCMSDVGLITIEGDGMQGVVGLASRAFQAVAKVHANILMISQSSSEQNICLVVKGDDADQVIKALNDTFELELVKGFIESISLRRNQSIISLVGEGMAGCPGVSGKLFSILGQSGINVTMIAQGSSEVNISFLIHSEMISQAMIAIHRGLFL